MLPVRRRLWTALLGVLFLAGPYAPVLAQPDDFPPYNYGFLSGSYVVIGKHTDSTIEKALHGEAKVLRIRFDQDGKSYKGTYLVDVDFDNYPRLTGYIYLADGNTKRVGLEALFADDGQLEQK